MKRRVLAGAVLLASLLLIATATVGNAADAWIVVHLTNNSQDDYRPQVSGDRVAWQSWVVDIEPGRSNWEIFTRVIGEAGPVNISNRMDPGMADENPQISGNRIVWSGWDGNDWEIYTWSVGDSGPTNISNRDGVDDKNPQISGNRVAWQGWQSGEFGGYDIYTRVVGDSGPVNISNTYAITDDPPRISGNRIVWPGWDGNDWEIYTWVPGGTRVNISNRDGVNDTNPQVSGSFVAWWGWESGDWDIFARTVGDEGPLKISSAGLADDPPQISGERVVWSGWDGNDWEIYAFKLGYGTVNISNRDGVDDKNPQISGNRVAWQGWQSGEFATWDIYTRVIGDSGPVNISNSTGLFDDAPQVSGDRVVWSGWDGNDWEIHAAYLPTIPLEHDAAGVVFDRWVTGYSSAYSGGGYVYGRWTDTELKATFTGSRIRWVGPKQPFYGMAFIYMDQTLYDIADCYAPDADKTTSAVIWESGTLTDTTHTIELRLTGQKNQASSGNVVVLDRFEVTGASPAGGGTRHDDSTALPGYTGTWLPYVNPTYYNKTYAYSRWAGAAFTLAFTGTRVSWIGPRTPNYGIADIYIDDAKVATVDTYRADLALQGWREVVWQSTPLSRGAHTLSIRPTGTKNPAATAANVVVDAVDVTP